MGTGGWICAGVVAASLAVASAIPSPVTASPRSTGRLSHRAAADAPILVATPIDLGTLGGESSGSAAVSRGVVVGTAETARHRSHAFAYDLNSAHPHMIDLGTLGGGRSDATDVSGTLVVGTSEVNGQRGHLFAYDLAAAHPSMVDLHVGHGVQVGPFVDGDVVAWAMRGPTGDRRAFAYDLGAPDPHPVDLGSIDGRESFPADVRGDVVVGMSTSGSRLHAFAYDLGASDPHLMDLDGVHDWSVASAVDGDLVVGSVDLEERGRRPFVVDLSSAAPAMRVVPALGGRQSEWAQASAVDGSVMVGSSQTDHSYSRPFAYDVSGTQGPVDLGSLGGPSGAGDANDIALPYVVGGSYAADDREHAFVYDLADPAPRLTDLSPGGRRWSYVGAVDGNVAAGSAVLPGDDGIHAVAWRLRHTTGPVLELTRPVFRVSEDDRYARVLVRRRGDTDRGATVRYLAANPGVWGFRAREGQDFKRVAGVLPFAAGQTTAVLRIRIVDDTAPEGSERFALYLARTRHGSLGTPQVARVVILPSDARPDAMIGTARQTRYVGDDVFNASGAGQSIRVERPAGGTASFRARVCLDPDSPHHGSMTQRVTLHANQDQGSSHVHWFRADGRDVTDRLRSRDGFAVALRLHRCREFELRTHVARTEKPGYRVAADLTARWEGDHTHVDRTRGVVDVVARSDARPKNPR